MKNYLSNSENLYDGCRNGIEDAWLEASQYVRSIVSRDCWQLCEQEQEEIVNDTLLYFLAKGMDDVRHPKAFKKLLRLKAKALAIDRWRASALKQIYSPPQNDDPEEGPVHEYYPPSHPDCERMVFSHQALTICRTIIDSLKKECRDILPQYFRYKVLGHGVSKLAEDLKKPIGSVAASVHRCLKKLYSHPQVAMIQEEVFGGMG